MIHELRVKNEQLKATAKELEQYMKELQEENEQLLSKIRTEIGEEDELDEYDEGSDEL
ncbi:MAG: hypothetical protein QW478_08390 [Candidatus Micrarchaeaceae archaeon]